MVMSGQVLVSWTACLRSFSALMRMSAAFLRSASDSMIDGPLIVSDGSLAPLYGACDDACARRIAASTRRGVSGVSLTSAPNGASASRTALAIAAGGAMAPPSPIPLTPYSVCGVGVCMCTILIAGNSAAQVALDDHRIDHGSAIFRDREIDELDHAGRRVDRHHGAMGGV